jgi:glycosyltransferase involved in cell wall biosynthesis
MRVSRVCHMTSVHQRYDVRIFLKECVSLKNEGYNVTLLCADNKKDEIKNGVRIISVKFRPRNRISRIINARKFMLRSALEIDADIYHFHDPELLPVGLKLKRIGKKVIYDAHEDVPRQINNKSWIPKILRSLISKIFEIYENYIVRRLDYVIAATSFIANRFKAMGVKSIVINNYPILAEFNKPIDWSLRKNECCYCGGLTRLRGIKEIVEAVGLSKHELHLCGEFESNKFENKIRDLPGFKYIKYYGLLDRKSVKKVFNISKIGIVTFLLAKNHIDAQPNKMFEYMAAGIPVIASNFKLWKSIIEKNNCGLCVDPYNINEISEAIKYLIRNDNISKKMGENGRKLIESEFNWEKESNNLLNIYNELVKF